jgi:hypothetical protein
MARSPALLRCESQAPGGPHARLALNNVTLSHISHHRMAHPFTTIRSRLDRAGLLLSGLCAVHCLLGLFLVSLLGIGGGVLGSPEIHRVGIMLAVAIGLLTFGINALRHGRTGPLLVGLAGLGLMATAIVVGHGAAEAALTICGVSLVAFAHIRNLRRAC